MPSFASPGFWECYKQLPPRIQDLADKNYELLKENPKQLLLHLKKVNQYWSARVGMSYRALAVEVDEGLLWFWIGNHADDDRLLE